MNPRLALAALFFVALQGSTAHAKPRKPAPKARPAAVAAPAASPSAAFADDLDLADWRRQGFSDFASHGVLWRGERGLLAWRLSSASAFGSLAAASHSAKTLVDLNLSFVVEGEPSPRFDGAVGVLKSYPRWAEESLEEGGLQAEAVTLFSAQDVAVAAVNLKNAGTKPLRVRPVLHLRRGAEGLKGNAELSARYPALWLELDRSQAVGRRLVDHVGVWLGAQAWRASTAGQNLEMRKPSPLGAGQAVDLELTWAAPQLLAPGQTLRVPVLLAWGPDRDALQKTAIREFANSAAPKGKAWAAARTRWAGTRSRLAAVDPAQAKLQRRAVLDLLLGLYGQRSALSADQFSGQKGVRDAFYSVDTPLAALGWAELDMDKAEAALLDLASFSAAAPAPLPPYTGEEKLQWEAAGLPLNALAAWELYHRDPQPGRAAQFLSRFGERLRNECAWWPGARDGDGNGLYAFAREEEKPAYLRRQAPSLPPLFTLSPSGAGAPVLQTWSVALSSLVAWQMQAAAALAANAGAQEEAEQLMAQSRKTQQALLNQAWDPLTKTYGPGLDALWPFGLGLDADEERAKAALEASLLGPLAAGQSPWVEQGRWEPWRLYFAARTLAAYGYFAEAHKVSELLFAELNQKQALSYEYGADASQDQGGSVATAAVVTQLLLERHEQEVFLTKYTGEFESRWLQFRALDGSFYMKRSKIPESKAKYSTIRVETPNKGKIFEEKALIFSSPEAMEVQLQSEIGMDLSNLARPQTLLFKGAHKVVMQVPAKARILVRFVQEPKQN